MGGKDGTLARWKRVRLGKTDLCTGILFQKGKKERPDRGKKKRHPEGGG